MFPVARCMYRSDFHKLVKDLSRSCQFAGKLKVALSSYRVKHALRYAYYPQRAPRCFFDCKHVDRTRTVLTKYESIYSSALVNSEGMDSNMCQILASVRENLTKLQYRLIAALSLPQIMNINCDENLFV